MFSYKSGLKIERLKFVARERPIIQPLLGYSQYDNDNENNFW